MAECLQQGEGPVRSAFNTQQRREMERMSGSFCRNHWSAQQTTNCSLVTGVKDTSRSTGWRE